MTDNSWVRPAVNQAFWVENGTFDGCCWEKSDFEGLTICVQGQGQVSYITGELAAARFLAGCESGTFDSTTEQIVDYYAATNTLHTFMTDFGPLAAYHLLWKHDVWKRIPALVEFYKAEKIEALNSSLRNKGLI